MSVNIHRDGHGKLPLQENGGGEEEDQRIIRREKLGEAIGY
jgi:hypothetical protein